MAEQSKQKPHRTGQRFLIEYELLKQLSDLSEKDKRTFSDHINDALRAYLASK